MIEIIVTTSAGAVTLPAKALLSISSWSTDLQDSGRASAPTTTLELSTTVLATIPELELKGTKIKIDGWKFIIDSIVKWNSILTINLISEFNYALNNRTYTGTLPSTAVNSASLALLQTSFPEFAGARLCPPVNLHIGELDYSDSGGWLNWSFKFAGLGDDLFLITYPHVITASANVILNGSNFFYPACTSLSVSWTFTEGSSTYTSDPISLMPDKQDEENKVIVQRENCTGLALYNAMKANIPAGAIDNMFSSLRKTKHEFSLTLNIDNKIGTTTLDSRTYTLTANCSDENPLWTDSTKLPGVAINTITGYVHNVNSTYTITADELLSWYEAHGISVIDTQSGLKRINPNEIDVNHAISLTADEIISYERCSTDYSAIKLPGGLKLSINGIGDDGSDLNETIEIGTITESTKALSLNFLGNLFDCPPCCFEAGTGPLSSDVQGPYLYCKKGRNLYDSTMINRSMWFGNHAGIFKGKLRELMPASGNQSHARDEYGNKHDTCIHTLIELDSTASVNLVDTIAKAGPVACLHDIPEYLSTNSTNEIISDGWAVKLPWQIGHTIALGDTVKIQLKELNNRNTYCKVGGITLDWSANEVEIRIIPFVSSNVEVEPVRTNFNSRIRGLL